MMRRAFLLLTLLGCSVAVNACRLAPVSVRNTLTGRWVNAVALPEFTGALSPEATGVLTSSGFPRKQLTRQPGTVLEALDALPARRTSPAWCLAEGELATRAASACRKKDADTALGLTFRAAEAAAEGLRLATPDDSESALLTELYNEAVTRATMDWMQDRPATVRAGRYTWQPDLHLGSRFFPGVSFDSLEPASALRQRGLRHEFTVDGLGAAFVASRKNPGVTTLEKHLPPEGIFYPASMVFRFAATRTPGGRVTMDLLDPDDTATVSLSGKTWPLAADFTKSQATLLSRCGDLRTLGIKGTLRPGETGQRARLLLMQPYHPDRIPLIMIHGLFASPLMWRQVTNEIRGDAALRNHYQIWHFYYPTGIPPLNTAVWLRRDLEEVRRMLDPELDDFATNHMVVVAHSMGGLLTHTLVSDSGRTIWDSMLRKDPDKINAPRDAVAKLKESLIFEAKPCIKRVIFIAVPHQGSRLASGFLGALARSLIALPQSILSTQLALLTADPGAWSDTGLAYLRGGLPGSVAALAPDGPATRELARLPIKVPAHSIMGQLLPGPKAVGFDGAVWYSSSHLPAAASELVVFPASHTVYNRPAAIREIQRILRLHIAEAPGPKEAD